MTALLVSLLAALEPGENFDRMSVGLHAEVIADPFFDCHHPFSVSCRTSLPVGANLSLEHGKLFRLHRLGLGVGFRASLLFTAPATREQVFALAGDERNQVRSVVSLAAIGLGAGVVSSVVVPFSGWALIGDLGVEIFLRSFLQLSPLAGAALVEPRFNARVGAGFAEARRFSVGLEVSLIPRALVTAPQLFQNVEARLGGGPTLTLGPWISVNW